MRLLLPQPLRTADTDTTPQAGASSAPAVDSAAPPVGTTTDAAPVAADAPTLTPAEVRALRNEAQNLRKRLKEREDKDAEAQRAAMSEAERLRADHDAARARLSALETEVRGYRLRDAIEAAVGSATLPAAEGQEAQPNPLHGISPRLAARLIDAQALQYGEDGAVQSASLRRALEALRRDFPEIAPAQTQAAPPAGAPFVGQRAAGGPPPAAPNAATTHIKKRYPGPVGAKR